MAKSLSVGEYTACLAKDPWKKHIHVDHTLDEKPKKKPETLSLPLPLAKAIASLPLPLAEDMKPHITSFINSMNDQYLW